jgi:membrane-bound serine protease (ClpP class)
MDFPHIYVTLLLVGLLLLGLEIVVPGGVLGVFGGVALLAAIFVGFAAFPGTWGLISAAGIIFLAGLTIAIWIKYFPRTRMGRILTLSADTKTYKAAATHPELLGQEGVALTTLRPAGIADIGGERVDVVAEGNWIEDGAPIKVIDVEGTRVTVREMPPA